MDNVKPTKIAVPTFDEQKIMEAYLDALLEESETVDSFIDETIEDEKELDSWKNSNCKVIIFQLFNMTISVPLVELAGVISGNEKLIKVPGRPKWYLGLLSHRKEKVHAVDLSWWIMPKDERDKIEDKVPSHYLRINSSPWAIPCHGILEVKDLKPEDVLWKKNNDKVPWISGTIKDKMATLVELQPFIDIFENKYKNKPE